MLSILIPVYNFDVVPLIREIHRQAMNSGAKIEIIVVDDCSDTHFKEQNRTIREWKGIWYEELTENIGRSKIRNKMAGMAGFPWLLFIDCDTQIERDDYIAVYLNHCSTKDVVCGGRIYKKSRPEDPDRYLRWKYGINREQKKAAVRNLKPWNSFMTNNFLVSAQVLTQVSFDESIEKYGHEDTFFGIELKRRGIPVLHIDNPLIHIGLEPNATFLAKTLEGIENLNLLMHQKREYMTELVSTVKIIGHFAWLKKTRTLTIYRLLFKAFRNLLLSNILSQHPCLLLFDLYKLGFMLEQERTNVKKFGKSYSFN